MWTRKISKTDCPHPPLFDIDSAKYLLQILLLFGFPDISLINSSVESREKNWLFMLNWFLSFFVIVDINECDIKDPCGKYKCVNQPGGYTCQCKKGFNFNKKDKECQGMHYFKITQNDWVIFNHQFFWWTLASLLLCSKYIIPWLWTYPYAPSSW